MTQDNRKSSDYVATSNNSNKRSLPHDSNYKREPPRFKTAYDLLQEQEELARERTSDHIRKNTDRMHYIDD